MNAQVSWTTLLRWNVLRQYYAEVVIWDPQPDTGDIVETSRVVDVREKIGLGGAGCI